MIRRLSAIFYDLHIIDAHYDPVEVVTLAKAIMVGRPRPLGISFLNTERTHSLKQRAVPGLGADAGFANRYAAFRRDMVYGERPDFETALATMIALAERLE